MCVLNKPYIKFCGLKRFADIGYANITVPDYAGFVFAKSKRQVTFNEAKALSEQLIPEIKKVGVFVNTSIDDIIKYAGIIDIFQLHGYENDDYIRKLKKILPHNKEVWKAFRIKDEDNLYSAVKSSADMILLDSFSRNSFGGTGKNINMDILINSHELKSRPYFLAGGLDAENIIDVITKLNPHGIDISSGIEINGINDLKKMREIISVLKENNCYAN